MYNTGRKRRENKERFKKLGLKKKEKNRGKDVYTHL